MSAGSFLVTAQIQARSTTIPTRRDEEKQTRRPIKDARQKVRQTDRQYLPNTAKITFHIYRTRNRKVMPLTAAEKTDG